MKVTPIVAVAYNRPNSLKRLLDSLAKAKYSRNDIPLIISIDKGDNLDVLKIAEDFEWRFGHKIVSYQNENLKLRRHIIQCGDLSQEYGSVIILEDDLYVSPYFYDYAVKALEFSLNKPYIGGISLYNHSFNVEAAEPFEIINDPYDNWYFQFASSWGEAWTAEQWAAFKGWYNENINVNFKTADFPEYVAGWPESSWLKYFIRYLVKKNMYFLYPKVSLTTNFGDAGIHMHDNTNYQVPLLMYPKEYRFSTIEKSSCIYDAFFENMHIPAFLGYKGNEICIDLYGCKKNIGSRYYLTRKVLNYKIKKSFGCRMRPHDANIFNNIEGNDFFLYDTSINEQNSITFDAKRKVKYCLRFIRRDKYITIISIIGEAITNGLKKKFKKRLIK